MSNGVKRATAAVRELQTTGRVDPQHLVRSAQDAALDGIAPHLIPDLRALDDRFDAVAVETRDARSLPPRPRLLTPWPDAIALLAMLLAFAFAANVGRIAGPAALEQLPVVAPLVAVFTLIALGALIWGVLRARSERDALAVQREESKATVRAVFLIANAFFSGITLIAMLVRVFVEPVIAPRWTSVGLAVAISVGLLFIFVLILAIRAYWFAKSTPAQARFIRRVKSNPVETATNLRLETGWNCADRATELADDAGVDAAIQAAYVEAIAEAATRQLLKHSVLKRLRALSWAEARYATDFIPASDPDPTQ